MEPLLILVVLPALIGSVAEFVFRDAKRATLTAAVGSILMVAVSVIVLDPAAKWGWIAALLVAPLPVAFAVAAVMYWYGRLNLHGRERRRDP
jgi:uncharacterized membrane protein